MLQPGEKTLRLVAPSRLLVDLGAVHDLVEQILDLGMNRLELGRPLLATALPEVHDVVVGIVVAHVASSSSRIVELKRDPRQVFHSGAGKARRGRAGRRILADRGAIVKQN